MLQRNWELNNHLILITLTGFSMKKSGVSATETPDTFLL